MFCSICGAEIKDKAVVCVKCGCAVGNAIGGNLRTGNETKEWLVTFLLCFFFGCLGAHRFYTGHTGIGLAQLFTFGGCGIWALTDLIEILAGSYKDAQGYSLKKD